MKQMIGEILDFGAFLLLMTIFGLAVIIYTIYLMGYSVYAAVTGKESSMNDWFLP